MTNKFLDLLREKIIIFDGAMVTYLQYGDDDIDFQLNCWRYSLIPEGATHDGG